jgi:hypothetical protein
VRNQGVAGGARVGAVATAGVAGRAAVSLLLLLPVSLGGLPLAEPRGPVVDLAVVGRASSALREKGGKNGRVGK